MFSFLDVPHAWIKWSFPKGMQRLINYHFDNLNHWAPAWQKWLGPPLLRFQWDYISVNRIKQEWLLFITHTQRCSVSCAKCKGHVTVACLAVNNQTCIALTSAPGHAVHQQCTIGWQLRGSSSLWLSFSTTDSGTVDKVSCRAQPGEVPHHVN